MCKGLWQEGMCSESWGNLAKDEDRREAGTRPQVPASSGKDLVYILRGMESS